MKKISLALIISSLLTSPNWANDLERLAQLRNVQEIQHTLASDPNNAEANFKMALYYDSADQLDYLKKSADLGFAEGQLQYGFYLLNQGKGEEGLQYLEKSASQNLVQAMTLLGDLYFAGYQDQQGNSVIERSADQAIKYLSQAIEQNSQDARYTLAYVYLDPNLGKQDISKAVELLERNIDYDNKKAHLASLIALIDIYSKGQYVPVDSVKLVDYFYLASLQGYVPSLYPVGMMQREGAKGAKIEITQDHTMAFENLFKAANAGYIDAMLRIGEMYFKGEGTEQSDCNAYIWMAIAEELSNSETKYSETILELIPRKDREAVILVKDEQLQNFSQADSSSQTQSE